MLYIICSLIVFTPLARGSVHPWATTIIQIGVILAAIFMIIENFSVKQISLPKTSMNKPIAAIILLCIMSFAFSSHKPFAFEGVFMLLTYITAYYITLASVRTRKQQRILVYVIISLFILASLPVVERITTLTQQDPQTISPAGCDAGKALSTR